MKYNAEVVEVKDEMAILKYKDDNDETGACWGAAKAVGLAAKKMIKCKNDLGAKVGDKVEIEMPDLFKGFGVFNYFLPIIIAMIFFVIALPYGDTPTSIKIIVGVTLALVIIMRVVIDIILRIQIGKKTKLLKVYGK